MHTFELTSPKMSISLRFHMQKMDFSVFRIALFNFRLLFAPANCLEIIQQIRDFRGDCLLKKRCIYCYANYFCYFFRWLPYFR